MFVLQKVGIVKVIKAEIVQLVSLYNFKLHLTITYLLIDLVNYQQSNSKVIDKILDTKEINSSLSIQDIRNRSKKRLDKGSIPLDRQLSFKTEKPSIDNQRLVKQNSEVG